MHTRTELHTHLMGMLSLRGIIDFLNKLGYKLPIDYLGKLNFDDPNATRIFPNEIIYNMEAIRQLIIPSGEQVSYNTLNELYYVRNMLISDLIDYIHKIVGDDFSYEEIKYSVYGLYLESCLKELISQDVEYVEISFSNAKIIENAIKKVDPKVFDRIKCKFLLSTDRSKVAKDFKQSSRHMLNLIEKDIGVGFDIMGVEFPLSALDMDRTSKYGLEQKLIPLIEKLNNWENTTLRIHTGEIRNSNDNTLMILKIIDTIATDLNIVIPPPQIRIGHGIHFRKSDEYLNLLKKFKCIIEVNASSNYALNNVDEYKDIPYNYYLDNDIEVVICSDGHGVYDTKKEYEDEIASEVASNENILKILKIDRKIIREKK